MEVGESKESRDINVIPQKMYDTSNLGLEVAQK